MRGRRWLALSATIAAALCAAPPAASDVRSAPGVGGKSMFVSETDLLAPSTTYAGGRHDAHDPSALQAVVTLSAVADTHVFSAEPAQNFGQLVGKPRPARADNLLDPAMIVGADDEMGRTHGTYRGLVRFDTTSIPRTATITNATLSAYYLLRYDWEHRVRSIDFFAVTSGWSENNVTWDSRPSANSLSSGSLSLTSGASGSQAIFGWKDAPLDTSLVQAWVSRPADNFGILLQDDESEEESTLRGFGTKEGSYAPKLEVEYTLSTATPSRTTAPQPTATRTPTRTPTREATPTPRPSATATATARPVASPTAIPTTAQVRGIFLPSALRLSIGWAEPIAVVATPRPACVNVLENGDFELGSSGWIHEQGDAEAIRQGDARRGSWLARLGERNEARDRLRNKAVLKTYPAEPGAPSPIQSATLRFAWRMTTLESDGAAVNDVLIARLVGETTSQSADIVAINNQHPRSKWIDEEGFDVTEQLVRRPGWRLAELQFIVTTSYYNLTAWDLDDVVLEVCASGD